jgi:hypothetical protein
MDVETVVLKKMISLSDRARRVETVEWPVLALSSARPTPANRANCEERVKLAALSYMYKTRRTGFDKVARPFRGRHLQLWNSRKGPASQPETARLANAMKV